MSRLIDADELKKKLADELSDALGETDFIDGLQHGLKLAIELAEETPTVDAEPIRHGHWVSRIKIYECSECGFAGYPEMNYCPWCGAKMDEVEE